MESLWESSLAYLEQVAGRTGERYRRVLVRARRWSLEDYAIEPWPQASRDFVSAFWPEKHAALPEEASWRLVEHVGSAAGRYGLTTAEGRGLLLALTLALGTDFDRDPLHPWAEEALNVDLEPEEKARHLHRRALEQIDKVSSTARKSLEV